jgi:hypothetical protein
MPRRKSTEKAVDVQVPDALHRLADDFDLERQVGHAMDWLGAHPSADYLDAAYAVTASPHVNGGEFGYSRWPEFVDAVRQRSTDGESV